MFGDGSTTRDYTYVDDIVTGVIASVDAGLPFEIINLGNSAPVSLGDFVTVVKAATGRQAMIQWSGHYPGDVPHTLANISKARHLLHYEPATPVLDGMRRFVEWHPEEILAGESDLDRFARTDDLTGRAGAFPA